jgi:hypothetical protein
LQKFGFIFDDQLKVSTIASTPGSPPGLTFV